jgi:hypothetical protein
MRRAYKFILLLYPRGHRDQFAEEMTGIFEDAFAERLGQGWGWSVRFAFSEVAGLIGGAAGAWFHRNTVPATTPSESGRPKDLVEAEQRINWNIARMVHAIANHQFERARMHSDQERLARENLRVLREKYGMNS